MRKTSKILTFFTALLVIVFSVSAALAVPMLWRGWYYLQARSLGLSEITGFSTETIHGAFNQVMDFLLRDAPFGTGTLKWSDSGMSHFADCKFLFKLDLVLAAVTGLALLVLVFALVFSRSFREKFTFSPPLLALLATAAVLLIFGSWAFVDFDGLFAAFHALCFPGKTNWIFDWRTDEIILILPEEFWLRTAVLAAGLALAIEGVLSLLWALMKRALTPKSVYEEILRDRQ